MLGKIAVLPVLINSVIGGVSTANFSREHPQLSPKQSQEIANMEIASNSNTLQDLQLTTYACYTITPDSIGNVKELTENTTIPRIKVSAYPNKRSPQAQKEYNSAETRCRDLEGFLRPLKTPEGTIPLPSQIPNLIPQPQNQPHQYNPQNILPR